MTLDQSRAASVPPPAVPRGLGAAHRTSWFTLSAALRPHRMLLSTSPTRLEDGPSGVADPEPGPSPCATNSTEPVCAVRAHIAILTMPGGPLHQLPTGRPRRLSTSAAPRSRTQPSDGPGVLVRTLSLIKLPGHRHSGRRSGLHDCLGTQWQECDPRFRLSWIPRRTQWIQSVVRLASSPILFYSGLEKAFSVCRVPLVISHPHRDHFSGLLAYASGHAHKGSLHFS